MAETEANSTSCAVCDCHRIIQFWPRPRTWSCDRITILEHVDSQSRVERFSGPAYALRQFQVKSRTLSVDQDNPLIQ